MHLKSGEHPYHVFTCLRKGTLSGRIEGIILLLLLLLIGSGCGTKKYIQEGESLLQKYEVRVQSDLKSAAENTIRYELERLVQQEPNDRALVFFKPRLYFYYRQQAKKDTSDFDKFIQNKLMEPPAIYDSTMTEASRLAMYDLLYRKGYLNAQVWTEDRLTQKGIQVTYHARLNRLFLIDTFSLIFDDPNLALVVDSLSQDSPMDRGRALSLSNLNSEKQRILNLLQNEGYTDFSYSNFDVLEVTDTSDATVNAQLRVLRSAEQELLAKTIGTVVIINRTAPEKEQLEDHRQIQDSVTFINFNRRNSIRPTTILRYLPFRPGDKLNRSKIDDSRSQLQLPAIKFANPRLLPREGNPQIVDIEIDLIREKKINVENTYQVSQNSVNGLVNSLSLLGLTASIFATNNNIFGGSELLSNDLIASIEVAPREGFFNAVNINFNNSIEFPHFVDYFGLYRGMRKLGLVGPRRYKEIKESGTSILNASYEYVDLFDFYNYNSVNIGLGFRTSSSSLRTRKQLQVTHPSITYFNPTTEESFNRFYPEGTFARRSFAPQFFTSLLFSDLTYVVEHAANLRGLSSAFITKLELSGLETYFINLIVNGGESPLQLGDLSFAQFATLDLDGRIYKQLNRDQSLAFRANIGVAQPFGTSTDIPYVRQFFLGGPNTIRAWRIRELGPGSHSDVTINREDNLPFFQAADLKILLNAEYRFDVFWRLEGALFVDAGNIWTLTEDERAGGQFSSSFLSQMAVGTGLGVRFDADYFRVVLDIGLKLRNPYEDDEGSHYALKAGGDTDDLVNLNFAINYPF